MLPFRIVAWAFEGGFGSHEVVFIESVERERCCGSVKGYFFELGGYSDS